MEKCSIIIGGGPAGLSAALYLARAGLKPLVFAGSPPGGQLMLTTEVENFPGVRGLQGPEIVQTIREQAISFGAEIFDENIVNTSFQEDNLRVWTEEQEYTAQAVLIATGAKALWLGLPSEQRLRGRGVSACATCDGFFFRGKEIAVVGGGDSALEEALTLTRFASKVYLIHRRDAFKASVIMQERVRHHPQIEILWNMAVEDVLGEETVTGLRLISTQDGSVRDLAVSGVFVAIGHKPDTELFVHEIMTDEKGYILNGFTYAFSHYSKGNESRDFMPRYYTETSRKGVFAAGDCVDHIYRQASVSSGMGVMAALDMEKAINNA